MLRSAHVGDVIFSEPLFVPIFIFSRDSRRPLLYLLYRVVDNFAPCRMPCLISIWLDISVPHLISVCASSWIDFIRSQASPCTPSRKSFRRRLACKTTSNAFSASSVARNSPSPLYFE